jgi:CHAT domain-containing protein
MSQENLGPGEDGLLEAWEIKRMKLHARLAVLSACETARGKISDGEGVIGLSWALFAAGCPSEVVSQWKVDSASNTDLMLKFHQRFRAGASAAEAMRDASLALAKDPRYRHPFYWAPFVAIGN